jgi:hypothetical protein
MRSRHKSTVDTITACESLYALAVITVKQYQKVTEFGQNYYLGVRAQFARGAVSTVTS